MPPQPPSESQILQSYLLHPSPLPTILPYNTFLSLLPKSSSSLQTTHAVELRRLYRDLQFQRDVTIDDVRRRIESECTRSVGLTARLSRQVRREEAVRNTNKKRKRRGGDNELEEDKSDEEARAEEKEIHFDTAMHDGIALSNTLPRASSKHNHTTTTLLTAMQSASEDLSSEIMDLEAEIEKLRNECEEQVGSLSDLRYGRLSGARMSGNTMNGSGDSFVEDEVIAALRDLKGNLEIVQADG
ncbi:hypothetical protein H2200_006598 [Cladophialophora chaetospira]|uniref:Cnl2/NKP2 family protein n=1 Tax=Cladophialophora chaetospira TaxID=386627 RepID=A0AA38X8M6_9EURO|nr:hypothetical protein H2200_006598 [Cladophialophora chaetospira]